MDGGRQFGTDHLPTFQETVYARAETQQGIGRSDKGFEGVHMPNQRPYRHKCSQPASKVPGRPCCATCMPDWDRAKSPAKYMQLLLELHKDLEFSLRKDLNVKYYALRDLANSMSGGDIPMLMSLQLASTATNMTLTNKALRSLLIHLVKSANGNAIRELALKSLENKREKMRLKQIRMRRSSADKGARNCSQDESASGLDDDDVYSDASHSSKN